MAMQFNQTSGRGGNRGGRGANRGFSRGGRGQGRGSGTGFSRGGRGASRGFSRGGRGGKRALSDDLNVGHSELGEAVHRCEELLICRLTNQRVPYFNAPVFLDNKAPIGKIEDVFGTYNDTLFSITMDDGIKPDELMKIEKLKVFVPMNKLLTKKMFLSTN